jgi:hypothetical protein
VLYTAHKNGCKFDGWDEMFSYERWMDAFDIEGLDPRFYANRQRRQEEFFPWDIIDPGIDKHFLLKELENAKKAKTSPDCRTENVKDVV